MRRQRRSLTSGLRPLAPFFCPSPYCPRKLAWWVFRRVFHGNDLARSWEARNLRGTPSVAFRTPLIVRGHSDRGCPSCDARFDSECQKIGCLLDRRPSRATSSMVESVLHFLLLRFFYQPPVPRPQSLVPNPCPCVPLLVSTRLDGSWFAGSRARFRVTGETESRALCLIPEGWLGRFSQRNSSARELARRVRMMVESGGASH